MTEQEAERAVLTYLAQHEPKRSISLKSIFQRVIRPSPDDPDAFENDSIDTEEDLLALMEDMASEGLLRISGGDLHEHLYSITDEGIYTASGFDQLVIEQPPVDKPVEHYTPSYDSSAWTGLPAGFVLTQDKQARLVTLLGDAERSLESVGATNEEKAMARAYIIAVRALAEAPEPPADVIWELLRRASAIAGIASLFVAIVALFVSSR